MTYRFGFKAEANWYAREMRKELQLSHDGALCPWRLAEHLGFPVFPMTIFLEVEPKSVAYFQSDVGQAEFSAITLFAGSRRLIIHNDAHARKRQAADIAHELAHALLHHPPKPPIDANGSRHYNKELESEANWLGPALLVSEEAALRIARSRMTLADASDYYGVSEELVQFRLNMSGALRRVWR